MKKSLQPLMSSASSDHWTPDHILERVYRVLGDPVGLDPACNDGEPNVQAHQHFRRADDGLGRPWHAATVFLNPPYGRQATWDWVTKLFCEWQAGRTVEAMLLVPARTDTRWFQELLLRRLPLCLLKGRLKFKGNKASAPFPSALFHLPHPERHSGKFMEAFKDLGVLINVTTAKGGMPCAATIS